MGNMHVQSQLYKLYTASLNMLFLEVQNYHFQYLGHKVHMSPISYKFMHSHGL